MTWSVPLVSGDMLPLSIDRGQVAFIVGANGSEKSALVQYIVTSSGNRARIRRISAHRRAWFRSGNIDMTPHTRRQFDQNTTGRESRYESRWMDEYEDARQSAVLFDLVAQENNRAREIARCVDGRDTDQAEKIASETKSPFARINEILSLGTLSIALENSNDEEILARHRDAGTTYSIAQVSDGERNAAIIAANVLTVAPDTVVLIDEPERHLHRAIIEPFLSALFMQRPDCSFVISTHEVSLPSAFPRAPALLVRACRWQSTAASGWDIHVIEAGAPIPEDLRRAILGARKRILFVEGNEGSMDRRLYEFLFPPDLSVVPKEGCTSVIRAVRGLREFSELHHIQAFGLIDRDDRSTQDVDRLAEGGVYALELCSVESLYYCSDSLGAVAERQAGSFGRDAGEMVEAAQRAALESLGESGVAERMAARRCERRLRDDLYSHIPKWQQIADAATARIDVSVECPYSEELSFESLVCEQQLDRLIARYPLRESRVYSCIARALELPSSRTYEDSVLARLQADDELVTRLRGHVGRLSEQLFAEGSSAK